jgi:hypothetical protein
MSEPTLTEFLLARIESDEAVARALSVLTALDHGARYAGRLEAWWSRSCDGTPPACWPSVRRSGGSWSFTIQRSTTPICAAGRALRSAPSPPSMPTILSSWSRGVPERWLPVVGYEGFYEVSDLGRVRSVNRVFIRSDGRKQGRRGRVLVPSLTGSKRTYPSVGLRLGHRRAIHALVCEAFHGPRPTPTHEVAHWDGDPSNNRAGNLRWATQSENQQDSIRHGTKYSHPVDSQRGELNMNARLTAAQVSEIRRLWNSGGITQVRLADTFGVSKSSIYNIVRGVSWRSAA